MLRIAHAAKIKKVMTQSLPLQQAPVCVEDVVLVSRQIKLVGIYTLRHNSRKIAAPMETDSIGIME